uniref:Phospholipid scramblase n=1 Tax=Parastrongyloides trichosuri TaxID=131310 RepID=A0A0N5A749_PARTI
MSKDRTNYQSIHNENSQQYLDEFMNNENDNNQLLYYLDDENNLICPFINTEDAAQPLNDPESLTSGGINECNDVLSDITNCDESSPHSVEDTGEYRVTNETGTGHSGDDNSNLVSNDDGSRNINEDNNLGNESLPNDLSNNESCSIEEESRRESVGTPAISRSLEELSNNNVKGKFFITSFTRIQDEFYSGCTLIDANSNRDMSSLASSNNRLKFINVNNQTNICRIFGSPVAKQLYTMIFEVDSNGEELCIPMFSKDLRIENMQITVKSGKISGTLPTKLGAIWLDSDDVSSFEGLSLRNLRMLTFVIFTKCPEPYTSLYEQFDFENVYTVVCLQPQCQCRNSERFGNLFPYVYLCLPDDLYSTLGVDIDIAECTDPSLEEKVEATMHCKRKL